MVRLQTDSHYDCLQNHPHAMLAFCEQVVIEGESIPYEREIGFEADSKYPGVIDINNPHSETCYGHIET